MKRFFLMVFFVLYCGTMFCDALCNKENDAHSALSIMVVVWKNDPSSEDFSMTTDTLFYHGDSIEWFNEATSEVKFKSMVKVNTAEGLKSITVYLEDTELFTLHAVSSLNSFSYNYPVLIESFGGYYIGRGYPDWKYWIEGFLEDPHYQFKSSFYRDPGKDWVEEREKNWKAIEPGWNKFVAQLDKEGKYRK